MAKVAGCLEKSTVVMEAMNELVKVPQIQETMRQLSKEMLKAGVIEEMMDDSMEVALGDDDELDEEADSEVRGVEHVTCDSASAACLQSASLTAKLQPHRNAPALLQSLAAKRQSPSSTSSPTSKQVNKVLFEITEGVMGEEPELEPLPKVRRCAFSFSRLFHCRVLLRAVLLSTHCSPPPPPRRERPKTTTLATTSSWRSCRRCGHKMMRRRLI